MKTIKITLVALVSLFLSGCIKEALMLDTLRGKWTTDGGEYLVTVSEDVSYLDLYNNPWTGTVTVNGTEQDCSNNRIWPSLISLSSTFYINKDIRLSFDGNSPKIAYKYKIYDSSISWDVIKTGTIDKELTFMADNNIINIKINLRAPVTALKRGVEYPIDDPRWMKDIQVLDLEFLSPTRIAGSIVFGDIITFFNGRWSANSSEITLTIDPEYVDKITQTHGYLSNSQELTLFKKIEYSKTDRFGAIPYDKISSVKQVIRYRRPNNNE